jgi:hypothetical protein
MAEEFATRRDLYENHLDTDSASSNSSESNGEEAAEGKLIS